MKYYRDIGILIFGNILFISMSILIFKGSFINLDEVTRYKGIIRQIFETKQNNKGERGSPFSKLAFDIEGIEQTLIYYNLFDGYDRLKERIPPGEEVTVYFRPSKKQFNGDLYQIEVNGNVLVSKSIFEIRERVGSVFLFLAAILCTYWGRSYIKDHYRK